MNEEGFPLGQPVANVPPLLLTTEDEFFFHGLDSAAAMIVDIMIADIPSMASESAESGVVCAPKRIATDLFCERSGSDSCLECFHNVQNHVHDRLIADRSIDHGVVNGAVRPFDVEILLDESDAFPINSITSCSASFSLLPRANRRRTLSSLGA
jgi:hypothetical protein